MVRVVVRVAALLDASANVPLKNESPNKGLYSLGAGLASEDTRTKRRMKALVLASAARSEIKARLILLARVQKN